MPGIFDDARRGPDNRACLAAASGLNILGRGVAQSGSASALGAEGRWFKSSRPDHLVLRSGLIPG